MWNITPIDGKDDEYKITSKLITYAIFIDEDGPILKSGEINTILNKFGFHRGKIPFMYYGKSQSTVVDACLAIQEIRDKVVWFKSCANQIRLIGIIEDCDMMDLIK